MPLVDPDTLPQAGGKLLDPDDIRSAGAEIGAGAERGVRQGLAGTIANALKFTGKPGDLLYGAGEKVAETSAQWAKDHPVLAAAQPDQHNAVTNYATKGAEMATANLPLMAVGGGLPGSVLKAASVVAPYAMAAGQESREKYAEQNPGDEPGADAAGRNTALAQGAAMGILGPLAGRAAGGAIGAAGRAFAPEVSTAAGAAERALTGPSMRSELAKSVATGGVENTTMMTGGAAAQAAAEQASGITGGKSPGEAAQEELPGAVGASLLFAPLGMLHASKAVKEGKVSVDATRAALANPDAPDWARKNAIRNVYEAMKDADPDGANNWSLNANEALHKGKPIGVDNSWTEGLHPSVFPELHEDQTGTFEGEGGGQPPPPPGGPQLKLPAPGDVAIPAGEGGLGPFEQSPEGVAADQDAAARDTARATYEAKQATLRGDPLTAAAFAGQASGAVDAKQAERAAEIPAAEAPEAQKPTGDAGTDQSNMNIRSALGNQPQLSLADAQAKIAAINGSEESPNNYSVVPHPKGGYGIVPDHFITPQVKELYAGLQSRGELKPEPNMTPFDLDRAQARAEDLTSNSGVEHEVVPHPYARDKFLVQQKDAFTSREQPRKVNDDPVRSVSDNGLINMADAGHGDVPLHTFPIEDHDALRKAGLVKTEEHVDEDGDKYTSETVDTEPLWKERERRFQESRNAIQEQGTGGVLQREPGEAGVSGSERGRVEPSVEGQEAAGQGEAAGVEEGPATGVQQDVARHGIKLPEVDPTSSVARQHGWMGITKPEDARHVSALVDASTSAGHSPELYRGAAVSKTAIVDPYDAPMAVLAHKRLINLRADMFHGLTDAQPHQIAHEGWHMVDADQSTGGMRSNDHPAFAVKTAADGSRKAVGGIMKAAVDAFRNKESLTGRMLEYPLRDFDETNYKAMGYNSAHEMTQTLQNEVFAQLGRMYGENPTAMKYEHPEAYELFKETVNGAKKSSGIDGLGASLHRALQRRDQTGRVRQREPARDERAAEAGAGNRGADNGVARVSDEHGKPLAVDEEGNGRAADRGGDGEHIVNIGLNTNDGKGITKEEAIKALEDAGVKVKTQEVKQSGTEPTLVATLDRALTPEEAHAVSVATHQEAIAQRSNGVGELHGPGAENWRPYNDDFLLKPTERPLAVRDENAVKRGETSAIDIREGKTIPGLPKNPGLPDIATALNKLAPKRSYDSVKDIKSATKQLFSEIAYQLKQAKSGLDWYAGDVLKAWRWAAQEHPELAHDPIKRQLVSIITGLHSPSVKARKNFTYGLIQYEHYKKNGEFSPIIDPTTGQRWSGKPAHEGAILHVNHMLADKARWDGDPERGVVQWLLTEHPKSVLAAERARYGVWARDEHGVEKSDAGAWLDEIPHAADIKAHKPVGVMAGGPPELAMRGRALKVGEDKELYLGTEMFGPKVGPFIGNLNGMNTHITVDVWATRTLRRMFGTLPTKVGEDGGIEGESPTPQERNIVTMMLRRAAHDPELQKLGIKNGPDAQGVAWFFEQQLYDTIDKGTESGFFSDGARDYAESKGHIVDEQGAGAPALADAPVHARPTEAEANAALREERPLYTDKPSKTDVFFSALNRAIDLKAPFSKDGTASAQMLRNWLDARTKDGTIKRDELQWTGLDDYLAMRADEPAAEKARVAAINADRKNDINITRESIPRVEAMVERYLKEGNTAKRHRAEESLLNYHRELKELEASAEAVERPTSNGKVTRDEVNAFLDQNGVKVEEKILGAGKFSEAQYARIEDLERLGHNRTDDQDAEYQRLIDEENADGGQGNTSQTKYADRVLPGGKNYRELLLTLPTKPLDETPLRKHNQLYIDGQLMAEGDDAAAARWRAKDPQADIRVAHRADEQALQRAHQAAGAFTSSHFDEPNILAHVRFNERTDANGKKVLFIEEIQSDWAQQGRKGGFSSPESRAQAETEVARLDAELEAADSLNQKQDGDRRHWLHVMNEARADGISVNAQAEYKKASQAYERTLAKITELSRQRNAARAEARGGVPNAPFVGKTEAWVALALKRMIRYAADNGFDRVAWTNGEQQAARYDLSKQIKSISAVSTRSDLYHVRTIVKDGSILTDRAYSKSELPDVVGKEMADRIVTRIDEQKAEGQQHPSATYTGLDLKVGGEGMKSFYDKIVPNVANDVLKKLGGGRVDEGGVRVSDEKTPEGKYPGVPVNGFDITPGMKAKVLEGQPLFVRDDGTKVPDKDLMPKGTGGKAAEDELQFTKGGVPVAKAEPKDIPSWADSDVGREFARKAGAYKVEKPWKQRWSELTSNGRLKFIQGALDQYRSILQYGKEAYYVARMANGSDNGVIGMLKNGIITMSRYGIYGIKHDTKGLKEVLRPIMAAGEGSRFFSWMVARRASDLMAEERENLFTPEEIAFGKTLNQHGADWKGEGTRGAAYAEAAKGIKAHNDAVLDVMEQAGVLDPEVRAKFGENYIYFGRDDEDAKTFNPSNVSGLVNVKSLPKLKGGTDVLKDPFENMVSNYVRMLAMAQKNNAARFVLKEAVDAGGASIVNPNLNQKTVDGRGPVFIRDGGKDVHYLIHDPLLAQSIGSMQSIPMNGPLKVFAKMKHVLTVGTTVSPVFRLTHLIREQLTAMASGIEGSSYNPIKAVIDGLKFTSKNNPDPLMVQWQVGGGMFHMGGALEADRGNRGAMVKRLLSEGIDPASVIDSPNKLKAVLGHTWDWWKETGERSDSITRANRYTQMYKQLVADGMDADRANLLALYESRDVLDYGLHGTSQLLRMFTQAVPFMNARAQGLYKLGRAAVEAPTVGDQKTILGINRRFGIVVGSMTLASIALALKNRDDKDMQARSDWDKDNYWAMKVGNNTMVRMTKPFELGAIATVAERGLDLIMSGMGATDREKFRSRLVPIIGGQLNMNPLASPIVGVPLQLFANYDWFKGAPIESQRDSGLPPEMHYGPGTSLTSRLIGKGQAAAGEAVGIHNAGLLSPAQLDFAINGFLGWIGTNVVHLVADQALRTTNMFPGKPTPKLDDYTGLGSFVHELPPRDSHFVEDFYKHSQQITEAIGGYHELLKTGQQLEAVKVMAEKRNLIQLNGVYSQASKDIGRYNQLERWIQMSNKTPDEKRAEIDRIDQLRVGRARVAEAAREAVMNR